MAETDFHALKRKELQALCKEHKIPANLKNVEMADKLTQLFKEKENPPIESEIEGSVVSVSEIGSNDAVVDKKLKKVRFSPKNELFEFTISCGKKRRGWRGTVSSRVSVEDVDSGVVKKRGRRDVKINEDYSEKRIKVVDTSDNPLFADVGGDEVIEEVVEVHGRVTRSKGQRIGGGVKRTESEVQSDAKIEVLDVKLKRGRRKLVMPSSSRAFELKAPDNEVTDTLRGSVSQTESEGEVKPDGKVEAVKVALRRGRRRSVMPSNWGTLDLPQNNEGTNTSSISVVQVESEADVEPGSKIEVAKVGIRISRKKSAMPPSSGTLDLAHNTEGAKSTVLQVESGGKVEPDGEIQGVRVELRRSRRKSLMPPHPRTFELESHTEGRNTSKSSLLAIDEAAGEAKNERKGPEVVGILKRPRHNTVILNVLGKHETTMQRSGTCVEEHETLVMQNNTRRSKSNASNKSLSTIDEFDGDAIIDQKNEPGKRKRIHKPKEENEPPKRKGNLRKFTTKMSATKNAAPVDVITNVVSESSQVGTVEEPDRIEAPPPQGPQEIEESIPDELSVPEVAKSTRTVTLNLNSGDKSVNIEKMPTSTLELEGMIQDNCVEGVQCPAVEMTNDIASFHVDASNRVVEKVHLLLEDDAHKSAKESKEPVEYPTILLSAGSRKPSLSADASIFYLQTDLETGSELKEADIIMQQSVDLVHLVAAVKGVSVQQNFDPVEPLRIPEMHSPIEYHPNHVNRSETSSKSSEKKNEDTSSREADGGISFTNLESDVEDHHVTEADETHKPEHLDLSDVDQGHIEDHEWTINEDDCLDDELVVSDQLNTSLNEDPHNPGQAEIPSLVNMDNAGSFQMKDVLSLENNTEMNAVTFTNSSKRREITSHAVNVSNPGEEGVASPVVEMMTGIASSHCDESAIFGITNSQNDHVDNSSKHLDKVEDVKLALDNEACQLAEENIDATELYSQPEHPSYYNQTHSKELVKTSTVSVSAEQPKTPFIETIDTPISVKVKEPLSCGSNIKCYSASTRKLEITSQVFEISNTDEDGNEMQSLFATPIKICNNSNVDETFCSGSLSENASCLLGSSLIVEENKGKDYENPNTQPLVIVTTNPEQTGTGSSVGNEENELQQLLASQTKTDASSNGNTTTPGSSVKKLEIFSYLGSFGTTDQHMVTPNKSDEGSEIFVELTNSLSINKTFEQPKETGSFSEESKRILVQETKYDHELGGKDLHELRLLEGNRFYLLSDEAVVDLFESDTPNVKFPESNHHVLLESTNPEVAKGELSCHLSNASNEPGEVTVRRVLEDETDDDQEPDEKSFNQELDSLGLLEGNRFYLLSDEAGFDLSELNTRKDNKRESLLDGFLEPMNPEVEKEFESLAESDLFSNLENTNVLKESDVMETIQEYVDSESSISVDFEKSNIEGCVNGVTVVEKEMEYVLSEKKKDARTIMIHGTPRKAFGMGDMKENIPPNKISQAAGDITALRPVKRRALQEVQFK